MKTPKQYTDEKGYKSGTNIRLSDVQMAFLNGAEEKEKEMLRLFHWWDNQGCDMESNEGGQLFRYISKAYDYWKKEVEGKNEIQNT
jgi:hypothetical protein